MSVIQQKPVHVIQAAKQIAASVANFSVVSIDDDQIAANLVKSGLLAVAINAVYMQTYIGGVSCPYICSKNLDHGVLLVGYGSGSYYPIRLKEKPYWIIKNSWGPTWGEKGYYKICRGPSVCGVETMVSTVAAVHIAQCVSFLVPAYAEINSSLCILNIYRCSVGCSNLKNCCIDYPKDWPEIFTVLAQQLQSADTLTSHRIFMVLFRTLKELSTKRLTSDQKNFAAISSQFFEYIWHLWQTDMHPILNNFSALPQNIVEHQEDLYLTSERWLLCLKIIRQLIISGFQSDTKLFQEVRPVKEVCPVLLNAIQSLLPYCKIFL
ncbi:hypothetical protein MKW98_029262 [Papaver atlanticum]|uniref:Peptidase C1A papain C-terminal domain-containing protein n=1 Tax=Papaver atlanticum TaxID=357466 RepID=A0AAD4SF95_9MAGN|nr:hypothetical protein MKW98_029262 [Papaver atlanticum]